MPTPPVLRRRNHFRDSRSPVSIYRLKEQPPMGTHRHEFVEIVVVLSGWGIHETGNVRHEIRGGDVLVINGRRSHAYEQTKALSLINVLMRESILEVAAKKLGALPGYHPLFTFEFTRWKKKEFSEKLRLNSGDLKKVCGWIDSIEAEVAEGTEGGDFLASLWLYQLMALLARCYGKNTALSPDLDMRLGRVLERMDREPFSLLTLKEMAGEAGMSERSFLRYFREATDFSPADYMIRNRIERAAEILLREKSVSVTTVAFRCGFNDSNYFSRQFRRVKGKTPREYRLGVGAGPAASPQGRREGNILQSRRRKYST